MAVRSFSLEVMLAGTGEALDPLARHLSAANMPPHCVSSEHALEAVWMSAPRLVVALGDAVADGGQSLRDGLLAEPGSATTPLLLVCHGRTDRRHAHVATVSPNLGIKRIGLLVERLTRELSIDSVEHQLLRLRISALLRQIDQEEAYSYRTQPGGPMQLSAPAQNPIYSSTGATDATTQRPDGNSSSQRSSERSTLPQPPSTPPCLSGVARRPQPPADAALDFADDNERPTTPDLVPGRFWEDEAVTAVDHTVTPQPCITVPAPPPDTVPALPNTHSESDEAFAGLAKELGTDSVSHYSERAKLSGMRVLGMRASQSPQPNIGNGPPITKAH